MNITRAQCIAVWETGFNELDHGLIAKYKTKMQFLIEMLPFF